MVPRWHHANSLNLHILSYHLIPRTNLETTFEDSPKNVAFSAGLSIRCMQTCNGKFGLYVKYIRFSAKKSENDSVVEKC
jgi:hypothetical protein